MQKSTLPRSVTKLDPRREGKQSLASPKRLLGVVVDIVVETTKEEVKNKNRSTQMFRRAKKA